MSTTTPPSDARAASLSVHAVGSREVSWRVTPAPTGRPGSYLVERNGGTVARLQTRSTGGFAGEDRDMDLVRWALLHD
ncbi:hypothetical protein [Cellulomonas bogoriensis]|uniref:Uncharacterized protein n=1 Tax=Cellulomonas bogoriensis 69B4 = DSM 16987 TaxID=1386082 RepID=A0A0A0BRK1_9CELL|nr:hypothetical protein [Cellulomonas bogoriensis]KGM09719.1 hypothetical protein N869_06295 [Cellulomonas bogoriensis 69B4 = DSM 16987]